MNDLDSSNQSKRLHEVLHTYWDSVRGSRPYPLEAEIEPEAIAEIWDHCFVVELGGAAPGEPFRYSYLGDALIDAYGDDLVNEGLRDRLVLPHGDARSRMFAEVIRTKQPVTDEAEFTNKNGMHVKYRSLLLPLGPEGEPPRQIIGVMRWKSY